MPEAHRLLHALLQLLQSLCTACDKHHDRLCLQDSLSVLLCRQARSSSCDRSYEDLGASAAEQDVEDMPGSPAHREKLMIQECLQPPTGVVKRLLDSLQECYQQCLPASPRRGPAIQSRASRKVGPSSTCSTTQASLHSRPVHCKLCCTEKCICSAMNACTKSSFPI